MSPIRFPHGSAEPAGQMSDGRRDRKRHLGEIMDSLLPSAVERLGSKKTPKKHPNQDAVYSVLFIYFLKLVLQPNSSRLKSDP